MSARATWEDTGGSKQRSFQAWKERALQTDNHGDWYTQRLIPDPKTSAPLWPAIQLPPPPPPSHPFIPPSHLPHFLPLLPWSQALDCFFTNTHTQTHTTPCRSPKDYLSGPKRSPKSIRVLMKSGERSDWCGGLDTALQRGRSETEDLATLPRHLSYPRWWHHGGQRPSSWDCD